MRPQKLQQHGPGSTLEVSEIFGPTLQGEGPSIGHPAYFLRLRRCNLQCSWCDTPYTWKKDDLGYNKFEILTIPQVVSRLARASMIVITGGEPLIWKKSIHSLVSSLSSVTRVEIETNGTIDPSFLADLHNVYFNVSPKLANAGHSFVTINSKILKEFASLSSSDRSIFKFVVSNRSDVYEVANLIEDIPLPKHKVYLMPQGKTKEEILERTPWLWEECATRGFKFSSRLHILAFGNKRGI